ncbi:MAG: hypothetical protein Hyperionvirus5_35 [Hyperionvirus sp.]|uniref:Uncharacterized protein n=1 Tax=Hyperionvirus sp. TaxID=2487770 RepID=A0A3G5ACZ7_9VIRU|nr:MAG: hypothetical protein Hyperionvirus5_35 [Hyperionvirus sp.]
MDNARIHHYKKLKEYLANKGVQNKIIYNVHIIRNTIRSNIFSELLRKK